MYVAKNYVLFAIAYCLYRQKIKTYFRKVFGEDLPGYVLVLFFKFIYFLAVLGLRCCARAFSSCGERGLLSSLRCAGFSLQWLLLLWSMGSRRTGFSSCGSWTLERRLSSCGARAYLLRGTWDLPGPGLEPVFPALTGGFLTTAPPGKFRQYFFTFFFLPCRAACGIIFPEPAPSAVEE